MHKFQYVEYIKIKKYQKTKKNQVPANFREVCLERQNLSRRPRGYKMGSGGWSDRAERERGQVVSWLRSVSRSDMFGIHRRRVEAIVSARWRETLQVV